MTGEQDQRISEAFGLERARLRNFIRKRVADENDVEDILQDAFYELVQAYRMMKPVEQVGAWLFQVARNRITDLFRKKRPEALRNDPVAYEEDGESLLLQTCFRRPMLDPRKPTRGVCCWKSSTPLWMSFPKSNAKYSSPTNSRVTASKNLRRRPAWA